MALARSRSAGGGSGAAAPPAGPRDYVAIANGYIDDVLQKRIPACKWVRLACKRQQQDLKAQRKRDWPYRFDLEKAARICRFIENLPHTKGKWAAKKAGDPKSNRVKLEPWQVFRLTTVFGWVRKKDGKRRFRRTYDEVPRKNGKSLESAGIGLYMLVADGEHGAEVYCGATTETQAWEVFRPARLICDREKAFAARFDIEVNAANLHRISDSSRFEPIIGKPGDGASPSCVIVDEYHEHDTSELYDTMETGMGAREQPLLRVITTAGDNLAGPCYDLRSYAQKVLEGTAQDEELFAIIYTIDEGDDWKSELALRKANPNYGISVGEDYLKAKQKEAISRASKQGSFRTKHLNQWVTARAAWMNIEAWLKAGNAPPLADWQGESCYVACDLASQTDVASRAQLFKTLEEDGRVHYWLYTRHYVPEDSELFDKVAALAGWVKDGHLNTTEGNEIDFAVIEADLIGERVGSAREGGLIDEFQIVDIAFDPWQATYMRQTINREAPHIPVTEFRQSVENYSPAMKEMEAAVLAGRFHHDGNPVMNWMISNVVAKPDARDNIYPRKDRDINKIDGAMAALMAVARAMSGDGGPSAYEERGILLL